MKKALSFLGALLLVAAVSAQTFVSTEPSNRNVLIEEFTGVNCGYCPEGHAICNQIMADHPGRAWAINIHEGPYAVRYKTQWGSALSTQAKVSGYPTGTVNRHVWTGNAMAMNRGSWTTYANRTLIKSSPVNIAAQATIDGRTRVLTVVVEMYYTADQAISSNRLNVALLQNNVLGPQSGMDGNPAYVVGNQYRHMHMLRDLLTGQWGEEITTIASGTCVTRTYRYFVPFMIGDVTITNLADLEVLAFVCEDHKEVLTACKAEMTVQHAGEPGLLSFDIKKSDCSTEIIPYITVNNPSENEDDVISDWVVEFNGQTYTYAKAVLAGENDTVTLPTCFLPTTVEELETISDSIHLRLLGHSLNGTPVTYTSEMVQVKLYELYAAAGPFTFDLAIDHYGNETSGHLIQVSNCTKPFIFGPYRNRTENTLMPARHIIYRLSPAEPGLYLLRVKDNDGITVASDETGFRLSNAEGEIFYHSGDFTKESTAYLLVTNSGSGTYGIDDLPQEASFSLYPNPTVDKLYIDSPEAVRQVEVLDINGRTVAAYGAVSSVNLGALATGVYVVRVTTENTVGMQKIVKE